MDPTVYNQKIFLIVKALQDAGNKARFDLSDQFPSSFGSTNGIGMLQIFQDFLLDVLRDPTGSAPAERAASRLQEQAPVARVRSC